MQENLESSLHQLFGHSAFRPGQKELVQAVLSGKDALAVMPTGGGKSLCFQLPAALLEGTAVVISPLIALMKDQVDALRARGIEAAFYNSSLSAQERRQTWAALASGKLRLLYMAPERMQQEDFIDLLRSLKISFIAIDEAHCISHWGHDFRPDYRRLGDLRHLLTRKDGSLPPVIALTATATRRVQADILERLGMPAAEQIITGFRRVNLSFQVRKCANRAEKFRQLRQLIAETKAARGSVVIYASTRKNVELVADELSGVDTGFYHAGLSDSQREEAQENFLSGRKPVLVATNAFGMGIDKANVRVVAHFDIPGSVEAYYQEAGRAGRDGAPGRCVLLFNYADVATQQFFIKKNGEETGTGDHLRQQEALLKQLVRYAYSTCCRQRLILEYFGDPEVLTFDGCGNCDHCAPEPRDLAPVDVRTARASQQLLAAVARVNGRFGKGRICEILKGTESAQVLQFGLNSLSTFGLLRDWTANQIKALADTLTESGYLRVTGLEYPLLSLTPEGVDAMKGVAPVLLPRAALTEPAEEPRTRRKKSGTKSKGGFARAPEPSVAADDSLDTALLETLRAFRIEEARRLKIPAYVVFQDKTLREIAARKPRDVQSLESIHGFGPKKLQQYGDRVVALVANQAFNSS